MGVIETKGKAERKYECDLMTIRISFKAEGADPAVVSKTVMDSCEKFIAELAGFSGLKLKDIHIDEDDVGDLYYHQDNNITYAKRIISFHTGFDMKLVNLIRQHLNECGYRHNIDVDYDYSKVTELHAEVVKEALLEAKQQADMLAESLGLKVEGLKKAEEQGGRHTELYMACEQERGICDHSDYKLSDDLSGKVKTMAVEVYAEWKVS